MALAAGLICQYLPGRVVAADDVRQVTSERIVSGQFPGLAELGIAPTTLELVLPTYMSRFQPSDFRAGAIAL